MHALSRRVTRLAPSTTVALTDRANELRAQGQDIVSLSAGEPDFDTPARAMDVACEAMRAGKTHYTTSAGIPELREAILRKLLRENGFSLPGSGHVLCVPGAKIGLTYLCLALLDEGDEVVCPEPAWVSYRECVRLADATYVPVPGKAPRFGPDLEAIEAAVTDRSRLFILNSPCNPTGAVWTRDELEALAEIVRRHERIVVLSDEIYERILFDGHEHVSFASLPGMAERTLTLNGFSKAYAMTGWRLGWCAGPRWIIEALKKLQQHSATCPVSFAQIAGATALDECDESVRAMAATFARRRSFICERLAAIPDLRFHAPEGTFYLFADFSSYEKDSSKMARLLLEGAKVAVIPGSAFGVPGEGYLRLSFATSMENLEKACDRIDAYLRRLREGQRV